MDPMTQSAQISSSQGFADGHNSAAKDSKLSDTFLSSSPVSLIQSPQDKRVALGSDNSQNMTSLYSSQSASFSPGNSGTQSDEQPDSPIKTSPVSERIKALEALAAKKKESEFRSDGYSHYKDRHTDKRSSIEIQKAAFEKNEKTATTTAQKKGSCSDKESPDSPFEVLGDYKQLKELEENEEWVKDHIPAVPDLHSCDIVKGSFASDSISSKEDKESSIPDASVSFAGVPDAFMDSPVKRLDDDSTVPQNPYAEEDCDFDLSFLPTAYMWNQQEKNEDAEVPVSPAPPAGFGSTSQFLSSSKHNEKTQLTGDTDPPEAIEVDSSGESDDTVIEDGALISATVSSSDVNSTLASYNLPKDNKETPPEKSERKLMQVPTINVIETDEPNYSDEEMELEAEEAEDHTVVSGEDVKILNRNIPESSISEAAKECPLENQFMEGYSPPSSPVESDTEYSPRHKAQGISLEVDDQDLQGPQPSSDNFPNKEPDARNICDPDIELDDQTTDAAKPICQTPDPLFFPKHKVDEKICREVTEAPVETPNPKTSFIQDDIYDRESFDYDYDAPPSPADDEDSEPDRAIDQPYTNPFVVNIEKTAQNSTPSGIKDEDKCTPQNCNNAFINEDTFTKRYPQDPYSIFYSAPVTDIEPDVDNRTLNIDLDDNSNSIKDQKIQTQHTESVDVISETNCEQGFELSSNSEPADSFVEFMRECLKSKQDEEMYYSEDRTSSEKTEDFHPPPTAVMDLEQEKLTINALKELGSSQEEEMESPLQSAKQDDPEPRLASGQSPCSSNTQPPSSQNRPALDSTYASEVEAIDEWVAEAYHLAEHVLTAVLTHLSVKDLIHWRDPKKSGVVFGVSMLLLLSLAAFSVISVVSYLLLALLCVTITFRIYKSVVQAVQKSNDGHPFKSLIEKDVSIPPETFRKHVDASLTYINRALKQLSRLFLVEDIVDSLKLAVVMWLLTYVGAVFNGITILILADILLFAVPPIYEKNKTQIDQYIDLARTQINTTIAKLQEKLPGAMKRTKTE